METVASVYFATNNLNTEDNCSRGWFEMVGLILKRGHFISLYQEDSLRPYVMLQSYLHLLVTVAIQHQVSSRLVCGLKKI